MRKINYKSDFDFMLRLTDCRGEDVGVPEFDWTARFYTAASADAFVASCRGGVYTNCFDDNGQLRIVCDGHGLPSGTLLCEFTAELPNGIYPDGSERIVSPQAIGIELVRGRGDCSTEAEAELLLPMLKGDKGEPFTYDDFTPEQLESLKGAKGDAFTYSDFTPEQIAELQKPAIEAAERAEKVTDDAVTATQKAEEATISANQAATRAKTAAESAEDAASKAEAINNTVANDEQARNEAEAQRAQSENARIAAEQTRASNELQRVANEQARVGAEQTRASEFATIKSEAEAATANANQAAEDANAAIANIPEIPENIVLSEPTDASLEAIEPNIVADALRKTEQALSPAEQAQVLRNLGNPELKLFVDMWNEAWSAKNNTYGKYDLDNAPDPEHPFYGNGLWMSYKEAMVVLRESSGTNYMRDYSHAGGTARTYLPIKNSGRNYPSSVEYAFAANTNLEVLNFGGTSSVPLGTAIFYNCTKLHTIINGKLWGNANVFSNLPALRDLQVRASTSLNFAASPLLSFESLDFLVNNSVNTSAITITVHPDVYAKLTDESNEEWNALLALAATKNIQFATV